MKCPKCKAGINHVFVYSKSSQIGHLEDNKIIDYQDNEILETLEIDCSECGEDITKFVKE